MQLLNLMQSLKLKGSIHKSKGLHNLGRVHHKNCSDTLGADTYAPKTTEDCGMERRRPIQ